ncbi:MAG TPA: hypothetical protein VJ875_00745 [Pyrinomonadaceae bacterium]|nr:hypothetical protein [Pyrinomonadaceae bacterium]
MSVLSFPRIYFKGFMEWDPCTFNNNDWAEFPTYDPTHAALNWNFLATQGTQVPPGITPGNFTTTFRPWAIKLQQDNVDSPPGPRVPAEWNMFGTHGVSFVQYQNLITTIIGGDLGYGQPVTSDPLIGTPVGIGGDGGSGPGRLVDTNPASPWSSQIYFGQFRFGSGNYTTTGSRVYRMHSRWLNPNRIYSTDQFLTSPASSIGVCFQTCIPYNLVSWPTTSGSQLITNLQKAAGQPGALGIMIRFTGYVNLYFMNGILNGTTTQPRNYEALANALASAWNTWNTSGSTSQFFSNPCYSHIVGVIGVWNNGELASVPGGRCLEASTPVAPLGLSATTSNAVPKPVLVTGHELKRSAIASAGDPVPLGPGAVNVDYSASLISLDFSGVIPELGVPGSWPSVLTKADFGPLTLGVVANGQFTAIAAINYNQYQQSAYEAKAGIIDIPFPNSGTGKLLQSGTIAIKVQGQTALLEQPYTAETDTRGIYLDENEQAKFDVTVCQMGTPTPGINLMIAKYDSSLNLIPTNQTQFVNFTNGEQTTVPIPGSNPQAWTNVTIFATGANGIATVGIAAQSPGFPVLAFIPFSGNTLPQPPASFSFTDDAFYTTVRVLPFDDEVPQEFIDLWNSTKDPAQAWQFVYNEILYVYDMLFNVMLEFVNLGSQQAVESNLSGIWSAIEKDAALESTYAMPITRDLSEGKRLTLQLWIYLVSNNYNLSGAELSMDSIPAGWTPHS